MKKSKRILKKRISRKRFMNGGLAEYPGSLQTAAELAQFGSLPGNTWASGLGRNAGLNDQMTADTGGYYLVGSGFMRKKKVNRM